MSVERPEGPSHSSSHSSDFSSSDDGGPVDGNSTASTDSAQDFGGGFEDIKKDLQSDDSLTRGNAFREAATKTLEEYQKILEQYGITPPGQEQAGGKAEAPVDSGNGSSDAGGSTNATNGGEMPTLEELIEQLAKELGVSEDELTQAVKDAQSESSGAITGTEAPAKDAMFA